MTAMDAAYQFLHDKLTGAAGLTALLAAPPTGKDYNIYVDNAIQGVALPFVLYQYISGTPTMIHQSIIVINDLVFQVKGVTVGRDESAAQAIAQQINNAIDQTSSSSYGGFLINCYRAAEIPNTGLFNVKDYRQAGGRYHVLVRPTIP